MRDGICPKCGSTDVHSGADLPRSTKLGSYWSNAVPVTMWAYTALDNYVCLTCGYVESYISEASALSKIRKKWPRVQEPMAGQPCPNCGQAVQAEWRVCPYCEQHLR